MASRGVNKAIVIGCLGQDPVVRYMPNGNAVANFTVATSEAWKDKQTGQQKDETEWHRVTVYQKLAEICGEYLRKGSKVYVEGRLKTRKWQDQQGQDRYTTEIIANTMQMLDSKPVDGNQGFNPQQQAQQAPANGQYQQQPQQQGQQFKPQQSPGVNQPPTDFDDQIPF